MHPTPITHLSIDGKRISSFTSIKLEQKTNDHHQFEIILDHDVIELVGGHTIDKSKDWLGKSLIITFGTVEFLGYITAVNLENKDGHNGNLLLNGYSPTILLEGGDYLCSWVNNTLEGIVNQTLESLNIGTEINPVFKEVIEFQVQYKENNYQFLQRLAKQYNEWFYYNGTQILFGKPKRGNVIPIEYGREISEIRMEIRVKDHRQTKFSYNERVNNLVASSSKDQVEGLNELGSHAFYTASEIYKTKKNSFTDIDSKVKSQIDDLVERKQATASAGLHVMKARSNKQGLTVGTLIKVASAKVAGKSDFDIQNYGEYMIINITHHATEHSEYFNTFEAIPSGITVPEEPDVALPKAENQLGTIVSNTDPKKIGRVQLRFDWQTGVMKTSWLRVMTPDAGSSKHHSKNRGHIFIPEVGDQVMVGFVYNNPNRPYVMGGMFHGNNGAGGSANNNIKSIITKSGNEIIFNDGDGKGSIKINAPKGNSIHLNGDGSITIFDASGNKIYMDNNENIDVTAPNHITFNSKKVTFNVMQKMQLNVLQKMFITTPFLQQLISTFYHTQAGKALFTSENEIKIESPELYAVGQKKLYLHSDELATLNSKGIVETKGEKGNKQSNDATDYEVQVAPIIAEVIVHFRPLTDWNGEGYGFDWIREGDTEITGDTLENAYKNIIGNHYVSLINDPKTLAHDGQISGRLSTFIKEQATFDTYKLNFNPVTIPWKKDSEGQPIEYYTPWISILRIPSTHTKYDAANPNPILNIALNIEVKTAPERLKIKYENTYFEISCTGGKTETEGIFDYLILPEAAKKEGSIKLEIAITNIQEIPENKKIEVLAEEKQLDGSISEKNAGQLKVLANDRAHRKQVKILLVNVETKISPIATVKNGLNTTSENNVKIMLDKFLNQALIIPSYKTEKLNLNGNASFNNVYVINGVFNPNLEQSQLDRAFFYDDPENPSVENTDKTDYNDYFRLYFFGESCGSGSYGEAAAIVAETAVIYCDGLTDTTAAHELFHAMGLYHSFSNKGLFTFDYGKTDCVMDYSDIVRPPLPVIQFYKWQWELLWEHTLIEEEAEAEAEAEVEVEVEVENETEATE